MSIARRLIALSILAYSVVIPASAQQNAAGNDVARLRQQLIGTYRLVWWVGYDQNGTETKQPYSVGQISYDAAGRMSAQLQRSDRETLPNPAQGYVAYFGRYEIDAAQKIVSHIVEGSTSANMIGRAMPRHFEFSPDGETLFLSTKTGDRVTGRLRWDRYK